MRLKQQVYSRIAVALLLCVLTGLLLRFLDARPSDVAVGAVSFGAGSFICNSLVEGKLALAKVSAALAAIVAILSALHFGLAAAIDHVHVWVIDPLSVFLAVTLLLTPAAMSRLNLRRRTAA